MAFPSFIEILSKTAIRKLSKGEIPLFNLSLEPTSKCNLKCTMCEGQKAGKKHAMEFSAFKNLVDEGKGLGVECIEFGGFGEPTIHPKIAQMIGYCKDKQLRVRLLTNLNYSPKNEKLCNAVAECDEINISIDGLNAETYEAIRKGGSFQRFMENLEKINVSERKPFVRATFVLQKKNQNQLSGLSEFCANQGINALVVDPVIKYSGQGYGNGTCLSIEELLNSANKMQGLERDLLSRGIRYDGAVSSKTILDALETKPKSYADFVESGTAIASMPKANSCYVCLNSLWVGANLQIYPCYVARQTGKPLLGDFKKHGLKEIWASKKVRNLQKDLESECDNKLCINKEQIYGEMLKTIVCG